MAPPVDAKTPLEILMSAAKEGTRTIDYFTVEKIWLPETGLTPDTAGDLFREKCPHGYQWQKARREANGWYAAQVWKCPCSQPGRDASAKVAVAKFRIVHTEEAKLPENRRNGLILWEYQVIHNPIKCCHLNSKIFLLPKQCLPVGNAAAVNVQVDMNEID